MIGDWNVDTNNQIISQTLKTIFLNMTGVELDIKINVKPDSFYNVSYSYFEYLSSSDFKALRDTLAELFSLEPDIKESKHVFGIDRYGSRIAFYTDLGNYLTFRDSVDGYYYEMLFKVISSLDQERWYSRMYLNYDPHRDLFSKLESPIISDFYTLRQPDLISLELLQNYHPRFYSKFVPLLSGSGKSCLDLRINSYKVQYNWTDPELSRQYKNIYFNFMLDISVKKW